MWERFKELYAGALFIAVTGWLLYHLILIRIHGVVKIAEGNITWLNIELGLAGLVMILAIGRHIRDWLNKGG